MSFDDWMAKRLSAPEPSYSAAGGGFHKSRETRSLKESQGTKQTTAHTRKVLPAEKRCSGCDAVKESDNFALKNNNKDGLDTRCKACESIRKRAAYHAKKRRCQEVCQ